MPSGTGLSALAAELPRQFFDVGIAEEHAVLFAAGLAAEGFRPVCAIYSTFLQRAYDPIIHDVALQNLPVTFCLDRAGLSPNDGPTHHGLFDLAYLRCVPGVVLMQPKDEDELVDMLHTSLQMDGPAFIRYPRGAGVGVPIKAEPARCPSGKAEVLRDGSDIVIWALGAMVPEAVRIAARLASEERLSVGVVNARFVKPLDRALLLGQAAAVPLLVTLEDHVLDGGFGSAVLEALQEADCRAAVERIGWPDAFIEHGTNAEELRAAHGLAPDVALPPRARPLAQPRGQAGRSRGLKSRLFALQGGDDGEVLQRRRVALHFAAGGDLLQDAAHDLSAAGLRQARGKAHVVGPRERADLLGRRAGAASSLSSVDGGDAVLERDEAHERLALELVGPADDGGLGDGRVRHEGALHLGGADAVAGDVEHVVDAADDPEIAVLVEPRAVAGEIVARQLAPVLLLEALVVAPERAQHRGPRLREEEPAAAAARDLGAGLVEHLRARRRRTGGCTSPA